MLGRAGWRSCHLDQWLDDRSARALVRGAVAVVLVGVVVAASGPEIKGGNYEQSAAKDQDGPEIEAREGGVHGCEVSELMMPRSCSLSCLGALIVT
ncbi:hypothetical protein [Synechococcus sp. SYN20]|uniref:hypothetical protein n=1 Tax=Synechococcus sp. SYN20 TaxID=1050714 RepID=UPI00164510C3|nr:hypothetical protein [Synechococcus sp. SYN20]